MVPWHPCSQTTGATTSGSAATAEEAVELACDWINDNIKFAKDARQKSDTILVGGKGNCTGMSYVACAIIRKLGIPAEPVDATFVGDGTGGHKYIEHVRTVAVAQVFHEILSSHGSLVASSTIARLERRLATQSVAPPLEPQVVTPAVASCEGRSTASSHGCVRCRVP